MKSNKNLLFSLNTLGHGPSNPILLRLLLTDSYTKADFGYTTSDVFINGGWIKIAQETFIEDAVTLARYPLLRAEGITIAPALKEFKSKKDWQYFSLYFQPIPQKNCTIHIIEAIEATVNDFNYYNIEIEIAAGVGVLI